MRFRPSDALNLALLSTVKKKQTKTTCFVLVFIPIISLEAAAFNQTASCPEPKWLREPAGGSGKTLSDVFGKASNRVAELFWFRDTIAFIAFSLKK